MSIRNREFSKRRKELIAQMEANSIALLASAPVSYTHLRAHET